MTFRAVLAPIALGAALFLVSSTPAWAVGTSANKTWGADARVWTVAEKGGIGYLGGEFQNLVDTSGHSQVSPYLGAIDLSTGNPVNWNPDVSGGTVYTIVISGSTMYIGGDFTSVG